MITPFYLGYLASNLYFSGDPGGDYFHIDNSPYKYCSDEDVQWVEGWGWDDQFSLATWRSASS